MSEVFKRPSLREAARRGVEANRRVREARAVLEGAAAPADGDEQPSPQAEQPEDARRTEQVVAKCGHEVPFELYPDGKDKWRESRRKQLTDRDCPTCRKKAHEERQAAEMEAARQRRTANAEAQGNPPAAPASPHAVPQMSGRLPHGSNFNVTYDAEAAQWTGTLTVPADGEPTVFTASAGGVFGLLRALDRLYRDRAAEEAEQNGTA